MLKTAFAGLLLVPLVFVIQSNKAGAMELVRPADLSIVYSQPLAVETFEAQVLVDEIETPTAEPEKPAEIQYMVLDNDSLSKIAEKHSTTWKRIYDKNTSVVDPNIISVGQVLVIPNTDETLADRPLPVAPEPPAAPAKPAVVAKKSAPAPKRVAAARTVRAGSSSGNLYTAGYCTWYVKNRKPSLPNNLGNADTWVIRARAQGMATGTTPRAGAVGQRGMHVVYVESVNGDGTVNISEMNHKGLYVITHRTLPADYFMYIY